MPDYYNQSFPYYNNVDRTLDTGYDAISEFEHHVTLNQDHVTLERDYDRDYERDYECDRLIMFFGCPTRLVS